MANRFANGRKSYGFCDLCGFRYDLKKLRNLVVKTKQTQIKACNACWVPDHPQLLLGTFPVSDPQAIRDPRPDTNTWYQSGTNGLQTDPTPGTGPFQDGFPGEGMLVIQWGWNPIGGAQGFVDPLTPNTLVGKGEVGTVTITDTGTPKFTLVEALYTTPGTYSWTAPAGVTSLYVLCVGGGGSGGPQLVNGTAGGNSSFNTFFAGGGSAGSGLTGAGGTGGTGTTLSATVFGGNGGAGFPKNNLIFGGGGGGAGGYSGDGGSGGGYNVNTDSLPGTGGGGGGGKSTLSSGQGGGGVGLNGQGANGTGSTGGPSGLPGGGGSGGANGSGSTGGLYGGGGGGAGISASAGGGGGGGGLRWSVSIPVIPGNSYAVNVGAGGVAAGAGSGANGAVKIAYWLPVP